MNWPALGRPFFPTTFSDGEKFSFAAAGLICRSKRPCTEDVAVGIAALISTPRRGGGLASCSVDLIDCSSTHTQ